MSDATDYRNHWGNVYREAYAKGDKHWRPDLATPPEFSEFLDSDLCPPSPACVLEAGCGDGLNAIQLCNIGYQVTGVDVVEQAIARAKATAIEQESKVSFCCADLIDESMNPDLFDLWVDIKMLHCLWEDSCRGRYLANAFSSIKPGGILFLMGGLAAADLEKHFPDFFQSLDAEVQRNAKTLDRNLPKTDQTGIRCETLFWYCQELEEAGFEILRAGRAAGIKTGWGAVVVARKPNESGIEIPSFGQAVKVALPNQIKNSLSSNKNRPLYERIDYLNSEAHESRLLAVTQKFGEESDRNSCRLIVKQYKPDISESRMRSDVAVHGLLGSAGIPVPAIKESLPKHNCLIMDWRGDHTLADRLKLGRRIEDHVWESIAADLARLHIVLNSNWEESDAPNWVFSEEQRLEWAAGGLEMWKREMNLETTTAKKCADILPSLARRLSVDYRSDRIIWGDCNPKNILLRQNDHCFIDFQPKSSSLMQDIVLLFSFADAPQTYISRAESHRHLAAYWAVAKTEFPETKDKNSFLIWYDDELLWRILVYGGNLLKGRERRLGLWREVCEKMLRDMKEIQRSLPVA